MKTEINYYCILLSLLGILFFNTNLMAVHYPVNKLNPIDYEKISIKEIEKQLDRKLKWKEKLAIRKIKKIAEKQRRKRKVEIELFGTINIKGNISKIQNDSIFLSDYVMKWPTDEASKPQRGKEIAIPIKQVDKILLKNTPQNKGANLLFIVAGFILLIAIILFIVPDRAFQEAEGFSGNRLTGGLLTILAGVISLIGSAVKHKVHSKSWLHLNGEITPEQMETLTKYLIG